MNLVRMDGSTWVTNESNPTSTSYNFTDIIGGTNYTFQMKAIDNAGNETIEETKVSTFIAANEIDNSSNKSEYYGATVTGYECENSVGVANWKIFYADNSNIYLIADDYIASEYVPNGKGESAINVNNTNYSLSFTNIVNDYTGSADITNSKIKALNNDYFRRGYTSTNNNMKAVAYMLDTNVWSKFKGNKAEYAIGGPTVEMLVKSFSQKYDVDYRVQASSANGYEMSNDKGSNWVTTGIDFDATDSLYVINNTDKARAMWVASPSAYSDDTIPIIHVSGATFANSYSENNIGLRPLVCLNSNAQLKKTAEGVYEIIE